MSAVARRSWVEDRKRAERLLALLEQRGASTSMDLWMASDDADAWSLASVQMRFTAWRVAGIIEACPVRRAPYYRATGMQLPDFEAANAQRRERIAKACAERNRARAGERRTSARRLTGVATWLAI